MKTIQLTQGQFTTVDDADHKILSLHKWQARWCSGTGTFYATRTIRVEGRKITELMHRSVLGLSYGDKRKGDHRNNDTLNNQRHNLRIATHQQNLCNRPAQANNSCGLKGVKPQKNGRFRACIKLHGKIIHLGYHDTAEQAAKAYDIGAIEHHGEFARTNYSQ